MTILQDILAAVGWQTRVTENFRSVSPAGLYGINPATTTGLTLGYLGGEFNGVTVATGTVALTASATNYVVAHRTTGAVTAAATTTDWLNTGTYMQLYQLVAGASTFTIAATSDKRQAFGGTGSGGGSVAGSDKQIQYNNGGAFGAEAGFEYDQSTNTATIPNCTFTGLALTAASSTSGAGIRLPHGAAPTTPTNGDVWTTTAGLFARINGTTVGPYGTGGGMSNPLTTTGDIIYSSSGSTAARLGIGSTNQVLTVVGGVPTWQMPSGGGGGLTNFTEAVNTSAPNATVPVVSLAATNGATNVDVAIVPKGSGAISAQIANNATSGGDKRGTNAVDFCTSRTLSANVASGASSVISGGGNNKASASFATVSGGNANFATASYSTVAGGFTNNATGQYSFVGGGNTNTASNTGAAVVGGDTNVANQSNAAVVGGSTNTASGSNAAIVGSLDSTASGTASFVAGSRYATTRGLEYAHAHAAGRFASLGDAQACRFIQRRQTTNATTTPMSSDGSTPAAATSVVLPDSSCYHFIARIAARSNGTGDAAAFEIRGAIKRSSGAGTVVLVGTPIVTTVGADAGASSWTVAAVANTTLGSLEIQVTGAAATTIKWVASIWTTEVVG